MPGKDGLLHISEIANKRYETMEETGLKEGDTIEVETDRCWILRTASSNSPAKCCFRAAKSPRRRAKAVLNAAKATTLTAGRSANRDQTIDCEPNALQRAHRKNIGKA